MANSPRFAELRRRLAELRRHLLPRTFSATGSYPPRTADRARGYRLLAHAEIEAFIEDISRDAAVKKIAEWKNHRRPSDLIVCFLAAYQSGWVVDEEGNPGTPLAPATRPKIKDRVEEAVDVAMRQYIQTIKDNHGVREANLKRLVLPVGVRAAELDPTWITNMDEFGKQRGEVAHKNVGAQQAIDPLTEYNMVRQLLEGLRELDKLVVQLAR